MKTLRPEAHARSGAPFADRLRTPRRCSGCTSGASRGWWWGMLGHVCSSRQPVALAAPQGAIQSFGRVDPFVSADPGSNRGRSRLTETRPLPEGGLSADPRSDARTSRLNRILSLPDMGLPACAGAASAPFGVFAGGAGPRWNVGALRLIDMRPAPSMCLSADMRPEISAHRLADASAESHMCLPVPFRVSASTRQRSRRVHPHHAFSPTPASRPPVAREACIQPSLSAREACIQDGFFSAPAGCPPSAFFTPSSARAPSIAHPTGAHRAGRPRLSLSLCAPG